MRVEKEPAREFYLQECVEGNWSTRQLERQINSLYFERILMSSIFHHSKKRGDVIDRKNIITDMTIYIITLVPRLFRSSVVSDLNSSTFTLILLLISKKMRRKIGTINKGVITNLFCNEFSLKALFSKLLPS